MSGQSKHPKMSRENRAKQFLPFAALKGYEEALREKEKEIESLMEKKNDPFNDDSLSDEDNQL